MRVARLRACPFGEPLNISANTLPVAWGCAAGQHFALVRSGSVVQYVFTGHKKKTNEFSCGDVQVRVCPLDPGLLDHVLRALRHLLTPFLAEVLLRVDLGVCALPAIPSYSLGSVCFLEKYRILCICMCIFLKKYCILLICTCVFLYICGCCYCYITMPMIEYRLTIFMSCLLYVNLISPG